MPLTYWLALMLVGAVLFILTAGVSYFILRNHIRDPKVFIGMTLTSLFILATTTTLGIIILWGAGVLKYEASFMNWLGGATVAEVAGILTIIVNFYFKVQTSQPDPSQALTVSVPPPTPVLAATVAASSVGPGTP
jgi:hypothetical protein